MVVLLGKIWWGFDDGDWGVETLTLTLTMNTIGYATIKWLTNGSQLHHLRLEVQGLEVKG